MRQQCIKLLIVLFCISGMVFIVLFDHWEPTGEEWYYWLFSRIFSEGNGFIILGRSPFYTLYLKLFSWLEYPKSVIVENFINTIIAVFSILIFFKRKIGLWLALFASVLWIPIIHTLFPTQMLAMAFISMAVTIRMRNCDRHYISGSYALLAIAFMLRPILIIFLFTFLVWDICRVAKQKRIKALLKSVQPRLADWPIFLVVILLGWFVAMQSPHKWNNSWISDTKWFPIGEGNSLLWGKFVQDFNTIYIRQRYKEFNGHDFYHTNQELFDGATNLKDAIKANSGFFIKQIGRNIKMTIVHSANWALFPILHIYPIPFSIYQYIMTLIFWIMVMYGAYRFANQDSIKVFFIGCVLLFFAFIVLIPASYYFYVMIFILIASASWYGEKIRLFFYITSKGKLFKVIFLIGVVYLFLSISLHTLSVVADITINLKYQLFYYITSLVLVLIGYVGKYLNHEKAQRLSFIMGKIITPVIILIFSISTASWVSVSKNLFIDLRQGKLRMMESRPFSMKGSFQSITPLIKDCKGIMSLEHTFIGAFMDISIDNIYDVFEIPPFGKLGDPDYNGLRPDRIDCLLVSNNLMTNPGQSTNYGIRYQNYIKPYAKHLQDIGATTYDLPQYGQAIIYIQNKGGM